MRVITILAVTSWVKIMTEFSYRITAEDIKNGATVKTLIRRHFSFSTRLRNKLKRERAVFLDGVPITGYVVLKEGDLLSVILPKETSCFPPEDIPLDILYEDNEIMAINKQPGVVVHPTFGCKEHTLANGISKYMYDQGKPFKIRFINRLDMDTSGLVLVGKNAHAQDSFVKQQQRGAVEKKYLAVVHGIIGSDGTVDAPIGKISATSIRRGVVDSGRASRTKYSVLETFSSNFMGYTVLEILLETGRTHQIRVHMSHIGHPIVGDNLYGSTKTTVSQMMNRQALHATNLIFRHPVTDTPLSLTAPLPEDINKLINFCY